MKLIKNNGVVKSDSVIDIIIMQKNKTKIPMNDAKLIGKYPVISQDKKFLSGYTDSESFICVDKTDPVILFGDHTTEVKFIDFNFCAGGDGTQIFKTNDNIDILYFYYLLKNNFIEQDGYKRHFKDLKEKKISYPIKKEQMKIIKFLKSADLRINKIKNLLEKIEIRNQYYADKLLSGELTIENNTISKNKITLKEFILDDIVSKKITSGSTPKDITTELSETAYTKYYKVETLNEKLIEKYYITEKDNNIMSRSKLNEDDILITIAGTLGRVVLVKSQDLPANINQAIAIIRVDETKCDKKYVYNFMKSIKEQIEKNKNDGAIQNLNLTTLSNFKIMLPESISYQKEVSVFLCKLNDEKEKVEKLLKLEEQRFEWLSDKLLSGEYIIED